MKQVTTTPIKVYGVDPRYSSPTPITHRVLGYVSRRALKRVKDRIDPPSTCDCCGSSAVQLVSNSIVYNRRYGDWPYIYLCLDCRAYVGLHPHTDLPLGTMANEATREARRFKVEFNRMITHKFKGDRNAAYEWLANEMGISKKECHWGFFTLEQCKQAKEIIYLELHQPGI